MLIARLVCKVVVCLLVGAGAARAETTVTISDIGTVVGDIATHVDSVTWVGPYAVEVPGLGRVNEVRGTVSGVGWGGTGMVPRPAGHYRYTVQWLARWHGSGKTLVVYHHGGPTPPLAVAQADCLQGVANVHRHAEEAGDDNIGRATLLANGTYIAMNRRGLKSDGSFSAKYLPPIAPLTAAEVDAQNALLAPACGAGYRHPELLVGAPVPVNVSVDTPTFRDVDRALARVVADISGNTYRERLSMGTSAGAVLTESMVFGCSPVAATGTCKRTGGNYVEPYDATSGKIFDGFLFSGFVYDTPTPRADAAQPISAPVFILQGRADERYLTPIRMANELLGKGVTLAGRLWIYEIANAPHVTRDNSLHVVEADRDGEPTGPYLGAAIANMSDLLTRGAAPPPSHIAGRSDGGALVYPVSGGSGTTTEMPVREDQDLDTVDALMIVKRKVDEGIYVGGTAWWLAVTAALPHVDHEIVGPSIACRVGSFHIKFFGAALEPFDAADLLDDFGSFAGYRNCVQATVDGLAGERLYDTRVESARATAERARAYFSPD